MRTLVLFLLGFFGVVLSGSCAPLLEIGSIAVDLLLLMIVPLALLERSAMPILFAALTGFVLDMMYSTIIGMSSLAYTLTAAVIYFLCRRAPRLNFFMVFGAGIGAALLKELIMAAVVTAAGVQGINFIQLLMRIILPGALLTGVLVIPSYWLFIRLMRCRFMRRRRVYADELG